jgi:hypothetical protein
MAKSALFGGCGDIPDEWDDYYSHIRARNTAIIVTRGLLTPSGSAGMQCRFAGNAQSSGIAIVTGSRRQSSGHQIKLTPIFRYGETYALTYPVNECVSK